MVYQCLRKFEAKLEQMVMVLFDPDHMRTTAVYTLEEADGLYHFYTEHAGGYSLAHRVSNLLEEARRCMPAEISAPKLMHLLVSDNHFLTEKAQLFTPLTEAEAQKYLTAGDGNTAFHITLDRAANTVHMENLPDAAECGLPALTFNIHGRGSTCDSLYNLAEACFTGDEYVEMDMARLHEKVFRETILLNMQTFEKFSCELDSLPKQLQVQDSMALT